MNKLEIGTVLKTERLKQNKSYYAVLKVGITQSQIEGIESGQSNYTIDILLKYAAFLNVSIDAKLSNF
jgi:transcriptional regulator with XRE-family HTH domain